jgi:tRNA(Ile)-lysidine synthase
MVQRVRVSLIRGGAEPCPHVLVGYSGGRDSLVLTVIVAALARAGALTADIVHVDHGARATSAETAAGVAAIGETLGLRSHIVALAAGSIDLHPGVGAEEAFRRERYRVYADVARATGAWAVALAHHQRDQAETVLLHLMRGSGLAGVAAMREWSELPVPWWNQATQSPFMLRVWRPLLGEAQDDIAAVAAHTGMPIFEDETNIDRRFRRNAVRHDVLPALESIVTGSTANLARFAGIAAEDDAALDDLTAEGARACVADERTLRSTPLVALSRAVQRRVVRRWLDASAYDGELTAERVDAILRLAGRNRSGVSIEIGAGWTVTLRAGSLTLRH